MTDDAPHIPVMLSEVLDALAPEEGNHIIDGTFGAGGYSKAILRAGAHVTGFDRDPNAVRDAAPLIEESDGRLSLVESSFSQMADYFEPQAVDGVVLDIGVSSMQLDQAERGFSFQQDGPLDMRMAQDGLSAADVVNRFDVKDLIRIIGILGEERQASRIAKAIVDARETASFETTLQLAKLIEKVTPRRAQDKIHPATRTFQGLRIFVNDELNELAKALFAAEKMLKPGGRLVVVTFHSLEDRLVKRYFHDRTSQASGSRFLPANQSIIPALYALEGKGLVKASDTEAAQNPRARSAKLRFGVRTDEAARPDDFDMFKLPNLPWPNSNKSNTSKRERRS